MPALTVAGGRIALILLCLAAATPFLEGSEVGCASKTTHCVDDTPGTMQEFATIQAAVNKARKGHTVLVAAGSYAGFRVDRSGRKGKRLVVRAQAGARIVDPEPTTQTGIYVADADYVTIEGFEVDGDGGRMRQGIAVREAKPTRPMVGVRILGNTVSGAELTNIYVSNASDSRIEDNVASGSLGSHGIYLANGGADDTVVRGNVCFGNAKNGVHFNGDLSVGGDGLHQGLLIEDNVLYDNAANGFDADGVRDSTFRNNLVYGNGRHGLRAFAIDAAAGPASLTIVNNTFVDNGGWAVKLSDDDGGHIVFNNILLSDDGGLAVESPLLESDFNVVHGRFSLDGDATTVSFAKWKAAGHDANSLRSRRNKLFVAAKAGDYRLRNGAPAVDAGTATLAGTAAPTTDIEGSQRPAGNDYDVGAYERGGEQTS